MIKRGKHQDFVKKFVYIGSKEHHSHQSSRLLLLIKILAKDYKIKTAHES